MDVIEIARTILRRWYVMVPVLLATAGLAYYVAATAESEYETGGSFLLTDAALVGAGTAPSAGASVSPQILAEVVQGDSTRARVRERGGTADYEVLADGLEGLVRVRATGDTEGAAVTTAELVMAELQEQLTERQAEVDVPEHRRTRAEVLSTPSSARQQVVPQVEGDAVRYVASGSMQLRSAGEQGGNPYAASLTGTVRVLEEVLRSPHVRQEIRSAVGADDYEVGMNQRDFAPIISIIARSTSPEGSMNTFSAVADRMNAELQQRQEVAGAPATSYLTLQPLSVPVGATLIGGELRRPLIVIVGLGLVAALSLAVLVEGLAASRRGSRRLPGDRRPVAASEAVPNGRTGESTVTPSVGKP